MTTDNQQESGPIKMVLQEYKEGIGKFRKKMPEIAKKYNAFTEACFAPGKLSEKQKQLIALAISVVAQDEYCIVFHTKACRDQGAEEKEILEALSVAAGFGGGAAMSQGVTLVLEAISEFNEGQTQHTQ